MDTTGPVTPISARTDSRPDVEHARAAITRAMADDAEIALAPLPRSAKRPWAMAEDGLRFLTRLVRAVSPRHVIEFGSGASTVQLLRESHEGGQGFSITSIEHDPRYAREIMLFVGPRLLLPTFSLSVAPLVDRVINGRYAPTYYAHEIIPASREPADVILVDGPPGVLGGCFGSIVQGLAVSRPGTIAIVDDPAHGDEQEAARAIADDFADTVELCHLDECKRGMSVLIVRDPAPFAAIVNALEPIAAPHHGDIGHQSDTFSRFVGRRLATETRLGMEDRRARSAQVAPTRPGATGSPLVVYVVGDLAEELPGAEARGFPLLTRDPRESKRAHARRFSRLVEAARAFGGAYLVVPPAHADWLAGHPHLVDYLEANHELVDADPESGLTFRLLQRG